MLSESRITELKIESEKSRKNVIRMLKASNHGHIGGAFSCIDMITALYYYKMNIDPKDPSKDDRDIFMLSAGHKCMAQYAVLAEKGYFSKDILDTYGKLHTKLPGHPNMHKLPGIEANTGALGHGLSIASGMAMSFKQDKKDNKVYVVMGDGELPEGSNWEVAGIAAKFKLDNLVVFVDNNDLQISGRVNEVMDMTPIDGHFKAYGWATKNIDGNNMSEIVETLDQLPLEKGRPTAIIAHTTKAKGLKEGEDNVAYHYWNPLPENLEIADRDIDERIEQLRKEITE